MNRQGTGAAPRVPETQGHFCFDVVPDGCRSLIGKALAMAGEITVPGTYECRIITDGFNVFEAQLRASAVTGTIAPTIATRYQDNTVRDSDAGVDFVANTMQELELLNLRGQRYVFLTFTVGAGEAITFNRAEFNGL